MVKKPETQNEAVTTETQNVEATKAVKGMQKIVTVYVLKSADASVNFPTKSRASAAKDLLTLFKVDATIETVKKTINID